MASVCVTIALTFLAFILLLAESRTPGPIFEEWHAVLAVLSADE